MTRLDLTQKRALVVGGGLGIGRATALALARSGAQVAVLDADAERARTVAREVQELGGQGHTLACDVTDPDEAARGVAEARRALAGLDVVINIVGGASWGTLLELDEETWERDFSTNLKHHWYVARSAARSWIEHEGAGALCMVGSVSGVFSSANHGAYGAAKAALLSLVRTAAEEWWPHDIRVNAVVPGAVRTPRIEAGWAAGTVPRPDPETLERMALPEDVAGPILFLVSDLARRVTGQCVLIDGGATTRFPYAAG